MSVDETHAVDDLFQGTEGDDESSIDASTTGKSDESDGNLQDAGAQDGLDKAKIAEEEQVNAWVSKVESGKLTKEEMVEELNAKGKSWLANKTAAKLDAKSPKVDTEAIVDEAVRRAEERFEQRKKESEAAAQEEAFKSRAAEIARAATSEQRATILERYKETVGDGKDIPPAQRTKMLELIAQTAGVTMKSAESYRSSLSSVKTGYGTSQEKGFDWSDPNFNPAKLPPDTLRRALAS